MTWSFDNPTVCTAIINGENEEEAIEFLVKDYGKAPNFKVTEVRLATLEEIQEATEEYEEDQFSLN